MNHPDKEEIVEKLIAGDSVRRIESWLKQKYPHNKKRQVSFVSLQKFRKEYLKLDKEVINDLQQQRKSLQIEKKKEQQVEAVHNMAAYKSGIASYVQDNLIDRNAEILDMMQAAKEGIEDLRRMNEDKEHHLNHQAIAGYLDRLKGIMEMHHKFTEAQKKDDSNKLEEDYEVLYKKMEIFTEAVKEAFNQTNPDGLPIFIQIVKDKMTDAGLQ